MSRRRTWGAALATHRHPSMRHRCLRVISRPPRQGWPFGCLQLSQGRVVACRLPRSPAATQEAPRPRRLPVPARRQPSPSAMARTTVVHCGRRLVCRSPWATSTTCTARSCRPQRAHHSAWPSLSPCPSGVNRDRTARWGCCWVALPTCHAPAATWTPVDAPTPASVTSCGTPSTASAAPTTSSSSTATKCASPRPRHASPTCTWMPCSCRWRFKALTGTTPRASPSRQAGRGLQARRSPTTVRAAVAGARTTAEGAWS